ncbi:MAG: rhomboid family intramembrane serine protease [Bacteroidetes bacterium HGW-Bacteroidetes-6]|jgi:membrane associated rhomboid family serine protease|nr:MAG: rhomboid family intramembrane serine protease [Bacteroidetes bacterium HGW-Bacteroidetes-6]
MDNYQQHDDKQMLNHDKSWFRFSLYMAFLLCLLPFLTFVFEDNLPWLTGVYPLTVAGLRGLLTAPLVHSDWVHLGGNVSALFILFIVIFNNYRPMALTVLVLSYVIPSAWLWLFARPAWHIGASGIVYALASFVFFTGVLLSQTRLVALSLFVVFMYGSIFWGIFPIDPEVSWEGHLSGFILGLVLAVYYRKDLRIMYPVKKYFEDETLDDDNNVEEDGDESQ